MDFGSGMDENMVAAGMEILRLHYWLVFRSSGTPLRVEADWPVVTGYLHVRYRDGC